jgi:hypothetical protein
MALTSTHNADVRQSLRAWTFPEEDRALFTTAPWQGEYRWFRSPNVIPATQNEGVRRQQTIKISAAASVRFNIPLS